MQQNNKKYKKVLNLSFNDLIKEKEGVIYLIISKLRILTNNPNNPLTQLSIITELDVYLRLRNRVF